MMRAVRTILSVALLLAVAIPLMAQEGKRKPKGPRPKGKPGVQTPMMWMFRGIDLTAEQKEKLQEIQKELGPKFAEIRKEMSGILTEEQKAAREEAMKKAREAGKRGREMFQAAQEAVKLTDEQKTKMAEVRKKMEEFGKQFREKALAVLTPEQKEIIKKRESERPQERKPHGRKPAPKE